MTLSALTHKFVSRETVLIHAYLTIHVAKTLNVHPAHTGQFAAVYQTIRAILMCSVIPTNVCKTLIVQLI